MSYTSAFAIGSAFMLYPTLTAYLGYTVSSLTVAGVSAIALQDWSDENSVKSIKYADSGEHKGYFEFEMMKLHAHKKFYVHPSDVRCLHSVGNDSQGAQDAEGHLLQIDKLIKVEGDKREVVNQQILVHLKHGKESTDKHWYVQMKLDWLLQAKQSG